MSLFARRVFFWILTLLFLGTTPIIIFFLMGYRYSFERGVFVYTGSISIQANPTQNLDIHLDGKPVSSSTNRINRSYHIEGVKPGKHTLSVSAPGFGQWSKEVTVKSGISTEFWNVLLTREQYEQTAFLAPEGSFSFFPTQNEETLAVLSEKNGETLITLITLADGRRRQIFSSTDFFFEKDSPKELLRWSPRDDTLLSISLVSKETLKEHTFLIQTDTALATDLKDIVRVPNPRETRWRSNTDTLLFLSEEILYEIPPDTPFGEASLSENIKSYDLVGNAIISLEPKTGILYSFPLGNPKNKEQLTTAPPEGFFDDSASSFSLTSYDKTRIAFIKLETGDLFFYNKSEKNEWFKKLSSGVKGIQFSDDGKKLLYWTDWEIFAIFSREWEVQPVRAERDHLDIGRFSSPINHVQWAKDYEHALFSTERTVKAIELDDRGGRNTANIITLPASPLKVGSLGAQNRLLFLIPETENSASSSSILSVITFPEPLGLFGFGG